MRTFLSSWAKARARLAVTKLLPSPGSGEEIEMTFRSWSMAEKRMLVFAALIASAKADFGFVLRIRSA